MSLLCLYSAGSFFSANAAECCLVIKPPAALFVPREKTAAADRKLDSIFATGCVESWKRGSEL